MINPGSGPGPNPLPDANYTREIPLLRRFDNVRLLGYVATTYANRDIALVREDIETYAAWPTRSSNASLAVNGIFFDETPQAFDANALAYYQELTTLVKQSKGLGPDNSVSSFIPKFITQRLLGIYIPNRRIASYLPMQSAVAVTRS